MKHRSLALIMLLLFCGAAIAQTLHHGSFFAAAISSEYVIVAIDSRASSDRAQPNDRHCKIQPLSESAFFFATGLSYVLDRNSNVVLDAGQTAKIVFDQLRSRNLDRVAESWGEKIKAEYIVKKIRIRGNPTIVTGFFAGTDEAGNINFSFAKVDYRSSGLAITVERETPGSGLTASLLYSGHAEIMQEFMSVQN